MRSKYRVEVFQGADGWYVRTRAANGQTLSVSESYRTHFNAKRAAKRVASVTGWPWMEAA